LAVELAKKPRSKYAKLANAQSLRPYQNPNTYGRLKGAGTSGAKSLKLIPMHEGNGDTELRGLLPAIRRTNARDPTEPEPLGGRRLTNQRSAAAFEEQYII
jgi:hypothetical protein